MDYSFQDILDRLPLNQLEFLSSVYDFNYEGMPLINYILEMFDNDFSTFEENSIYDTFNLLSRAELK